MPESGLPWHSLLFSSSSLHQELGCLGWLLSWVLSEAVSLWVALIWRDEHKNPCYPHLHGSLLLLSRPRYLHLWADGGPAGGLAVQQCHPETELVLRSAGSWLKGQGTKEEDVVRSEKSQRKGTSPTSRGVLPPTAIPCTYKQKPFCF